jgi:hypothetical protein
LGALGSAPGSAGSIAHLGLFSGSPGMVIPNLVMCKLGANGNVDLFNLAGDVDIVSDLNGYFA